VAMTNGYMVEILWNRRETRLRRSIMVRIQLIKRSLLLCISFIVALTTAPLLHAAETAESSDHGTTMQEIFILNSYHPGYAWSDDEQAGVIDVFRGKDKTWVPVVEYLDLKRLPDGRHLTELKKLFRLKHQNKKFSMIIAMDNPALEFAIDNQAELFRNAPIVFCGINNYSPSLLNGRSDVTGISEAIDIAGTIEVMLRLHPATQEIFSPHDYTATGLAVRKELEALAPRFGKVRFHFTDPLTMEELLKELEGLPKDSLVLEIGFITDKSGRTFDISETTKLFYERSPVPIYSTYEQRLGFGIVGGKLLSPRIHGANAARIALRVLAGEKASTIPIVFESDSKFMFDNKVMSRFGIPLSVLPEHSTVINKPVSFYAAHRVVIQTALGIIVFLTIIISLLTINIIQRRRSAIVLCASEEILRVKQSQLQAILDYSSTLISIKDLNGNIILANRIFAVLDAPPLHEFVGKNVFDLFPREVAENLWNNDLAALKLGGPVESEEIVKHKDGNWHTYLTVKFPVYQEPGQPFGICAISTDITERKWAEEKIKASLREKDILISEIHHRVKNNLQVMSGLLKLQARASKNPEVIESFNESQDRIRAMALVHEKLYNSKDFSKINLAGYMRSLSQELFISHNIHPGKIDLTIEIKGDIILDVSRAISCGLVMNELISNALKHAFPGDELGKLQIIIRETESKEIEIIVRDNGVGLPDDVDIDEPRSVGLHLVNGLVKNQIYGQIEVKRDNGTEFRITFPL